MRLHIIHFAIYITFYLLGAYATTDILRLIKGTSLSLSAPNCYCPICHTKISLKDQIPIISYLKNHGVCRNCKSPIPLTDLFLELFLFLFLSAISFFLHFSWISYGLCIISYEATKFFFLLHFGKREDAYRRNLFLSLCSNLVIFSLTAFLFALEHTVHF